MFGTSPNKHMYNHLKTEAEVEAKMNELTKEMENTKHETGMAGLATSLRLKFQMEQLAWRHGEIIGIDYMNA